MDILQSLLTYLKKRHLWFTTKTDPTYEEPSSYYELDEYGDPTEKACKQIEKEIEGYVGDGAVTLEDAIKVWCDDAYMSYKLGYKDNLITKFKPKEVVPGLGACENSVQLTENVKTRLREENKKSLNLISQMFQDKDFDSESNEGKIVMKTSELFNTLSDKGYDVQVNFDNGESQSRIFLAQEGGAILITITNADQPLKAYSTGNYEITNDNIKILQDVIKQIENL